MLQAELAEILRNGENSGVEFKRDDVQPKNLAKEMAALLNLEGGHLLLGVEDDGTVSGLMRDPRKVEEWVMELCREHLQPAVIPFWETIPWDEGKIVGVLTLPGDSPDKPYKARKSGAWQTYVRVGTTSRVASREEEARLYQASGWVHYDIKTVPGSSFQDLDMRRLRRYFGEIRGQDIPTEDREEDWLPLLVNTELMMEDRGRFLPTVGAMLTMGHDPSRFLRHATITAVAYPGTEKDYAANERAVLRGPLVAYRSSNGAIVENGLVEECLDFIKRHLKVESHLDGGVRVDRRELPDDAIREALVNAVAHRDYTIHVTDIEVSIYSDRLEVISPGRLPNTVTVEKMRYGYRATRNELIKEILRDHNYIEATGLGVPRKIIRGMREHNGTEPDLIDQDDRLLVRLWKGLQPRRAVGGPSAT